jgi:hypothetical protein
MSWTFKEMHIYKFRLVRYRWWFVATFVNQGFINVNCKENFVFSPVLQVSKYTLTTLDTLGVLRCIFPMYFIVITSSC